jgi:hypothetical protein
MGKHWSTWAPWGKEYSAPVQPGFLIHNLEHGGIALTYNCSTDRPICIADLQKVAKSLPGRKWIIAPNPGQQQKYAIRAWGKLYTSTCFDKDSAIQFATAHYSSPAAPEGKAESDPPKRFDPTSPNKLDCSYLMEPPKEECPNGGYGSKPAH